MLVRTFLIKLGVVYDDTDAKAAEKDVEGIGKAAAKAEGPIDKLDQGLDDTARSAKKAGAATAAAGRKVQQAGTQVSTTSRAVGKLDGLMGKLGASLASFGPQLAAAGVAGVVAGVGKAIAFVGDETARLDKIAKDAQKTGFGVEAIQVLGQIATLSGSDIEKLTKGISNLNIQLDVVSRGGVGPAGEALQELGLTFEDLQDKDPTEQLKIISGALAGIPSEADKSRVAFKLMGEEGKDLIPLFNSGAEAIDKMAASVGPIFSREDLARAEAYQDSLAELDKTVAVVSGSFAIALAPTLSKGAELLEDIIPRAIEFGESLFNRIAPAFEALADAARPWIDRLAPEAADGFSGLLTPLELALDAVAFFAEQLAFLLDIGDRVLTWIEDASSALESRLATAFEPVGAAIEEFFAEPLERVREVAGEVFDFVEGLVDGIGTLGNEARSIRAAVGLGGGGGSLGSAQGAAAALAQGAATAQAQAQARQAAQEAGAAGRTRERQRQRGAFARTEAAGLRRRARRARPRGGGGGRAAAAAEPVDLLEQLGLTAPGAIMAERPAPESMTIIIAPVIKMIEQLVINVEGGASPEQRRALDDAATQARDAVFVKLADLPALADNMFRLQAKTLQAAASSRTLPGGS
jgi:hypothetical protein